MKRARGTEERWKNYAARGARTAASKLGLSARASRFRQKSPGELIPFSITRAALRARLLFSPSCAYRIVESNL